MTGLGERAVVLGASMGGLLATRVLADFFETVTVVERDALPDDNPAVRRGVPQARHVHVLLARGAQILDELFPGFLDELVDDGAPVWDDGELSKLHLSFGGHDILRSGRVATEPKALAIHMPSRPFLECHVRRRLRAMSNVTILSGHEVAEVTTTPDRRSVSGVRVVDPDRAGREFTADVVMDAMGRGAHTPALLERLGYGRPVEDHIVMHTNYVSQLLRIPHGTLREMLVDIGPAPDRPAGMFLSGYEDDTWMFTVFGMAGHQPPRDLAGMLSFAQEYCPDHLIAAMRAAEPVSEVAHHHMPSSQWRRYDKMPELPDGLLVCGDAICSVNPIYGQGMTLAALQAVALRESLRAGGADLARRYFRASAKPIEVAWQMVASLDLAFPAVAGRRSRWMRIATRLMDWAMAASESDLVVAVRFFRVNSLIDSPIRLLHPAFLYRVAVVNVRRRRAGRQSRRAADWEAGRAG
jgi:2-polyprenyl-6-methoxyphenol hydroxylase-like FAD-dependent oxidoreductase